MSKTLMDDLKPAQPFAIGFSGTSQGSQGNDPKGTGGEGSGEDPLSAKKDGEDDPPNPNSDPPNPADPLTGDQNAGEGGGGGEGGEGNEPPQYAENADDRAIATYGLIEQMEMIPEGFEFDGTVESIGELFDILPTAIYEQVLNSTQGPGGDLLRYVTANGGNVGIDQLQQFFEEHTVPAYQPIEFSSDQEAYDFLFQRMKDSPHFTDDQSVTEHLDKLVELEKMRTLADKQAELDNAARKQTHDDKIKEAADRSKELQDKAEQRGIKALKYIDEAGWADDLADQTKKLMTNQQMVQNIDQAIQQSPRALAQLASIYTMFDPEKGEFDFSRLTGKKAPASKAKLNTAKLLDSAFKKGGKHNEGAGTGAKLHEHLKPA